MATYENNFTVRKELRPKLLDLVQNLEVTRLQLQKAVKFDDDGNAFFSEELKVNKTDAMMA